MDSISNSETISHFKLFILHIHDLKAEIDNFLGQNFLNNYIFYCIFYLPSSSMQLSFSSTGPVFFAQIDLILTESP